MVISQFIHQIYLHRFLSQPGLANALLDASLILGGSASSTEFAHRIRVACLLRCLLH